MLVRPVSRDQFEVLGPKEVRHKPLGTIFSAYPDAMPPEAPVETTDEDGYEYDHNEVAREANDMLRELANGSIR